MDIQGRLTAFAMLGAGWVMWLLVLLSIVSLAIILERIYFLFSTKDDFQSLRISFLSRLSEQDVSGAQKVLSESKSSEAQIVLAGLANAQSNIKDTSPSAAEERMAAQAQLSKLQLEKNLAFLGTVGNNAPFVGLLGTVIGIIRAFQALEQSAGQVSNALMAEIGEALVATAIGLLVALPAVAFFNIFNRAIRARLSRADSLGHDLIAFLKDDSKQKAGA